ncbi:MAG: hypothetical protein ACRDZX_11765 [Acidimicrobiales bacterium]
MNYEMIDRVRSLAPPVETTGELDRAHQRRKLDDAIAAEMVQPEISRALSRRRSWHSALASHRRRYLAAAAAAAVAAAGTAVPLALGAGATTASRAMTKGGGPVMQLASYRLRLPRSYHLTAAAASDCHPMYMFGSPGGGSGTTPSYASTDAAAATASGGCIAIVLAAPYTPTASQPDPEAAVGNAETHQVEVGPYNAWIYTGSLYYTAQTGYGPVETVLFVELPLAGGKVQDLVVGEQGLSQPQLVALVANGLSVPGGSPPASLPSGNTGATAGR